MDKIKPEHIVRTIYDLKENSRSKHEQKNDTVDCNQNFLNDLKSDLFDDNCKFFSLKKDVQKNNAGTLPYEESYELRSTAVYHLSYLDEIKNLNFSDQQFSVTLSIKNYTNTQEKNDRKFEEKKSNIDKEIPRNNNFSSNYLEIQNGSSKKSTIEVKPFVGVCSNFFKKNILVTKSEVFIRNLDNDQEELLENIKRQLPTYIDTIWVNGKIIWSKK